MSLRDRIYYAIFPNDRVRRWSYPIWNHLPARVVVWLLGDRS